MGGHCLSHQLQGAAALLPAGAQRAGDFLRTLDCFFSRTSERWLEAYGRVVLEAMACGLPMVWGRRGGRSSRSYSRPSEKIVRLGGSPWHRIPPRPSCAKL